MQHPKRRGPDGMNIQPSKNIKLLSGKFDSYEYTVSKSEIQAAQILASRYHLQLPTPKLVGHLAGIGGSQ